MSKTRLLIVPRWGGTVDDDWYQWLAARLDAETPRRWDEVHVCAMPSPERPQLDAWPAALRAVLGKDPVALERTWLLGHDVGCQTIVRVLARLPEEVQVAGVLCVGGWFALAESTRWHEPWTDVPFLKSRVREATRALHALLASDDPVALDRDENEAAWRALGAEVSVVEEAGAFLGEEADEVLAALDHLHAHTPPVEDTRVAPVEVPEEWHVAAPLAEAESHTVREVLDALERALQQIGEEQDASSITALDDLAREVLLSALPPKARQQAVDAIQEARSIIKGGAGLSHERALMLLWPLHKLVKSLVPVERPW